MAASKAQSGMGMALLMGDGATPEVFTSIGEVAGISGPQMQMDTVDVTHMGSDDGIEEVIPTILRSGSIQSTMNLVPDDAQLEALRDAQVDRTLKNFRAVYPTVTGVGRTRKRWSFKGYVVGLDFDQPHDNKMTGTVSIKITAPPVLETHT